MADPFSPKFVDLVCNNSTTQGTGNFVLGAAPNGYTGFATAVAASETFYYSALGVDKPAEREVGRGTMQANGTISRTPISGPKTNFTSGTKTISLIAAAEWFTKLEAAGSGAAGVAAVATRSALASAATAKPCVLTEAGREGLFVFDGSAPGALIAADTTQGVSVAPASGSGAWMRQFSGGLDPLWFGLQPGAGYGAANSTAMLAMLATARALGRVQDSLTRTAAPITFAPATEAWEFNGTIDLIDATYTIAGCTNGYIGGYGTALKFTGNTTGIRVQHGDTSGATGTRTRAFGAGATLLRNLRIEGAYAGIESEAHGVHLRTTTWLENVSIVNFAGDGVHIRADVSAPSILGNANTWSMRDCVIGDCRDGLYLSGGDTNGGTCTNLLATSNRRWGIADHSFLGNAFVSGQLDTNGIIPGSVPTQVTHGGNRYCVKNGQAAGASTNAPSGTTADNAWWLYVAGGGANAGINVAAWASGTTYREGGAATADDTNSRSTFTGVYCEGGQSLAQFAPHSVIIGGMLAELGSGRGGGRVLGNYDQTVVPALRVESQDGLYQSIMYHQFGVAHYFVHNTIAPNGFAWRWVNNSLQLGDGIGGSTAMEYTGATYAGSLGTKKLNFPNGYGLAGKKVLSGTAAPASGAYVAGDLLFNAAPAAGGPAGWKCVASGSPGTWEPFGEKVTLTGDVTGSGTGNFAATIAANAVSFAKIQDVSGAGRLIGRGSAGGAGDPEEITLGAGLAMTGTALSAPPALGAQGTAASVTGTTAETLLYSLAIPANSFKVGDQLRVEPVFTYPNSASVKTLKLLLGPTQGSAATLYSKTRTTSVLDAPLVAGVVRALSGAGNTLRPYDGGGGDYISGGSTALATATVDWTVANTLYITGTLANAAETLTLECVRVARA